MKSISRTDILNVEDQKSKHWPQWLVVLTASISAFVVGAHYSWTSPSIPILLSNNSEYNITSDEASYIAIIGPLGDLIGAPAAAVLADLIGRKNGILLISVPTFLSWLILAFSKSTVMFCLGRFMAGIGDGMLFIVYPMYMGEVTEPKIRGVLGCSLSVSMLIGMLAINIYGPYLPIRETALISSVFSVMGLILFFWMPESPYYLIMKGKMEQAKKSLYFLRRCDVDKEFQMISKDVQRQMTERGTLRDLLCVKWNQKALLTMIGIRTVQQLSGISAWGLFTQSVFMQAGGEMSPVVATIIYLCAEIVLTAYGSILLDKYGRKPILLLSTILTGIVLVLGGVYFYIKDMTEIDTTSVSWIPLVVMVVFVVVFGIGLGTVPSLMLGELFSASIKGKALCIMCIYNSLMISITSKLFYFLTETYGIYSSYLTFGSLTILSFMCAFYFVPETKGKTLEDIQQYFRGNDKSEPKKISDTT